MLFMEAALFIAWINVKKFSSSIIPISQFEDDHLLNVVYIRLETSQALGSCHEIQMWIVIIIVFFNTESEY